MQQLQRLAYQFIPIAILSIIIGLCGKFFTFLEQDLDCPSNWVQAIKAGLLFASAGWSLLLCKQYIAQFTLSLPRKGIVYSAVLFNLACLIILWWPAILGHAPLSEVEMIRLHLIVPSE